MKELNLKELMELYQKNNIPESTKDDFDNFSMEIAEAFPALVERLRVAEKVNECLIKHLCKVLDWGTSKRDELLSQYTKEALAELAKEDQNG